MKKLILSITLAITTSTANAWTPKEISEAYNGSSVSELLIMVGYVVGVKNTIKTTQEYDITDQNICFPRSSTVGDTKKVLNSVNYRNFENTDTGGVVYIYSAYLNEHGC